MKANDGSDDRKVETEAGFNEMRETMDRVETSLRDSMEASNTGEFKLGDPKEGLSAMGARLIQEQLHREVRAAMEPAELSGDFKVSYQAVQGKGIAERIASHQFAGRPG